MARGSPRPGAHACGSNVLRLLIQTENELFGECDYLLDFHRHDAQPPPDDEAIYTSLRHRLLAEQDGNQWRLWIPLMQHWPRQRA